MSKINLKDNEIHDLTMFVLNKINLHQTEATVLTDEALKQYLAIFNQIENKNKKVEPMSLQY